jgi:hypothetical protein
MSDRERTDGAPMAYTEDIGFRIVILHQFVRFLTENPKENFLTRVHWDILINTAYWLMDKTEELRGANQAKQELKLQKSDADWTADTLKEAA